MTTTGIDIDSKDHYNSTPLSVAARLGHAKVVELLLTESHAINTKDTFGRTPLWWAERTGNQAIAELLFQKYQAGIEFQVDSFRFPIDTTAGLDDHSSKVCDVCDLLILISETSYHCHKCSQGDFDICKDCFAVNAHCLDGSHNLIESCSIKASATGKPV